MMPKGDAVLSFHLGQVTVFSFEQGYQVPFITDTSKSVNLRESIKKSLGRRSHLFFKNYIRMELVLGKIKPLVLKPIYHISDF